MASELATRLRAYATHGVSDGIAAALIEAADRLDLLSAFRAAWERCESNRGCYSCCAAHDCRCESLRKSILPSRCTCGRDALEAADDAIRAEIVIESHSPEPTP